MKHVRTSLLFIAMPLLGSACSPQVDIGSLHKSSGSGGGTNSPQTKTCDIQVLATGLQQPNAIAYANHLLFVATRDANGKTAIVRIPLAGGTPTPLASGISQIANRALTADATRVYWATLPDFWGNGGQIASVSVSGGTPVVLAPAEAAGTAIASDLSYVYWGGEHGSVFRTPVGGGATTTLYSTSIDTRVDAIAVDAGNVYWGATDSSYIGTGSTIKKLPLTGGAPTDVMHIDSYLGTLAPYGGYLYVENSGNTASIPMNAPPTGNGILARVPIDLSSPAVSLASNQAEPTALAVDASGLYWGGSLEWADGFKPTEFNRIAADTTKVEAIGNMSAIAQMTPCMDGICWVDQATGQVNRFVECDTPSMDPNPHPAACDTFCTSIAGCAPSDCVTTCEGLLGGSCAAQGAVLAACIASHTDSLTCKASGCDQETQAYNSCRGFPSHSCASNGCGAFGNVTLSCQCDASCTSGQARSKCDIANGTATCTCYLNETPIGTCQEPSQTTDVTSAETDCSLASACCSASF